MRVTSAARAALVCALLLANLGFFALPSVASEEPTLAAILAEYDRVKPGVHALTDEIRESRKAGAASISGKTLEVRKQIGDLVKRLRQFDKEHLRASKGARTYADRSTILKLFHTCDAMLRLIDAETKSTDFQLLGLKYEEMWKQADTALTGGQLSDVERRGTQEEFPVQRLGR